jgi:phosphate transport system permease protein
MAGYLTRLRSGDEIARLTALTFALAMALLTVLIAVELFVHSAQSRQQFGWSFLSTTIWDPVAGRFGAASFIYGTLVTSAIALVLAVPLGVGAALFLAELAPQRISEAATLLIELLAAVPSIVYGLIGVAVLVPLMREHVQPSIQRVAGWAPLFSGPVYGVGYLTAALVLAIMIVPFIVSVVREVLLAVPRDQREAALALGATRWESTSRVVLPYARLGVFGALFLALGRALGETMAVTMVIGNRPAISASLFAPGYSMAAVIANEFTEATADLHLSALIEIGLVLFLLTMIINALARVLVLVTARRGAL